MRVLVSEKIADGGLQRLRDAGHEVDIQLELTPETLLDAVQGSHALIIRSATKVTREVLETRTGPWLKLAPADPDVNLRALVNSRGLDGPFLPLDDFRFVGAVERAISGHPKFGEHLSLYEPERDDRPYDPTLREILELGFRGPYTGVDEEPLPPALVSAPDFLPEVGSLVHLRLEPPARGLDIGFID